MHPQELRLDLVSPLPPVRTGIADYCADLLPHLAARCDLRLVQLPGQPVEPQIAERWPLVPAERLGEDGRLPLYQMGNNHHHLGVYDLALERPGVLTLHDVLLHHFLIDRTYKEGDFEAYRQQLELDHGWIGDAAARPLRWPGGAGNAAQFSLPAHRSLLAEQRGVLVHSIWAAESLLEEIPELAVRSIPMGVPLPPAATPEAGRAFRRRHGLPVDRPLLGCFGFQTPMKRTQVVISTLADPRLAGVHLMVAGEVAPILQLDEAARRAGVENRVHFLGFLPFEEFEAAIAAADLCLNLRYPTAGETSASLLRILAAGRAAVVSDYAQMAELPASAGVVKVPPGDDEGAVLAARLASLLEDPDQLRELGRQARRHVVEHHAPATAAAAVVEACRQLGVREPPRPGPAAPPRPTSLVWDRLSGELEVTGAEPPWPEGERRWLAIRLTNGSEARWLAGERPLGGVAVEVQLMAGERDRRSGSRWLGLPFDLDPGDSHVFEIELRRPLGPTRLNIVPHVLGRKWFGALGGPWWTAEV